MVLDFLISYNKFLINSLHLKPLLVGIANTLLVLVIIALLLMIVVSLKSIFKAHNKLHELVYNLMLLSLAILAQTYMLSYIRGLIPDSYIFVSYNNYSISWFVIAGIYAFFYFFYGK